MVTKSLSKTAIAASIPTQNQAPTIPSFDALPDSAFIRERSEERRVGKECRL